MSVALRSKLVRPQWSLEDGEAIPLCVDDGWICGEDEVADGAWAAQLAAHLDSVARIAPEAGQFDDADLDELL